MGVEGWTNVYPVSGIVVDSVAVVDVVSVVVVVAVVVVVVVLETGWSSQQWN